MGGNAVILNSANKDDDWFWTKLENAKLGLNNFSVYNCHYQEHPEFCDPKWEAEMRQALSNGTNGFGGFSWSGFEREYEQKAAETVQTLNASKKVSKRLWRSIFDEWEGSPGVESGEHK
jgi:hypothetical protein